MKNNYLRHSLRLFLSLSVLLAIRSISHAQTWTSGSGLNGGTIYSLCSKGALWFAGTDTAGVYKSSDQGQTWTQVSNGLTDRSVRALVVKDNLLVAGLGNTFGGATYTSSDDGASWQPATNPYFGFLFCMVLKGSDILIGTWYGVAKSSNNGDSWTTLAGSGLPSNASVTALVVSGNNIFAGVSGSSAGGTGVFMSSDNGATWTAKNTGLTNTKPHALAVNGSTLYAGTESGLFKSTDNGNNWTAINTGLSNIYVNSLIASASLFAGTNAGIFLSNDDGGGWVNINGNIPAGGHVNAMMMGSTRMMIANDANVWSIPLNIVSAKSISAADHIQMYPNPVHDILYIETRGSESTLLLSNQLGQRIYEEKIVEGLKTAKLDVSRMQKGVYFLRLENADGTITKKIVIGE